ncbi:MAG: flagellar biosynthesis protein FlhF [Christensenellales bacterium]
MFVKRFVASDMQEAIKKIRKDFGPDAVILDSKHVRGKGIGGILKKNVEVVAAYEPNRAAPVLKPTPEAPAVEKDAAIEPLAEQIKSLKSIVADISNRMRINTRDNSLNLPPELLDLYHALLDRDVCEDLAHELVTLTHGVRSKKDLELDAVAQQIVMDRLGEPISIKLKKFEQTVLMFAGPTGAGKTTTLVKLAGRLALDQNQKVGLINMDTYRVGAMEHMRIYSDIMDIPLKTAYNAKELKTAVEALAGQDVILIDTAGKSVGDASYRKELQDYIAAANVDEIYLVLSIVTGSRVCKDIIRNYSFIPNYRLIVTKLDEVGSWGNILNIADYAKKPLSYITMGQNVPDDISQVDTEKLADNIIGRREVVL